MTVVKTLVTAIAPARVAMYSTDQNSISILLCPVAGKSSAAPSIAQVYGVFNPPA
jgi:hypothetical protein